MLVAWDVGVKNLACLANNGELLNGISLIYLTKNNLFVMVKEIRRTLW